MTLARSKPRSSGEVREPDRATYERDFYTWALEQAASIREGRLADVDRENVAEEIERLGAFGVFRAGEFLPADPAPHAEMGASAEPSQPELGQLD